MPRRINKNNKKNDSTTLMNFEEKNQNERKVEIEINNIQLNINTIDLKVMIGYQRKHKLN